VGRDARLQLKRYERNPLIAPRPGVEWEHRGTFNPGAVGDSWGRVHILYRAVDSNGTSRLGYASTADGAGVTFRSLHPVFSPSLTLEEFGCEDPRLTRLDDVFYATYTAFSRQGPRIGIASTTDFSEFKKLGIVGPNADDKDFVLFPERIDGKVAALHRLGTTIQIAYFDDIRSLVDSEKFWSSYIEHVEDHTILRGKQPWETWKVGAGPPPVKTARGWLLIYHGISANRVYSAGAALLDLKNPSVVLARTRTPILIPETTYEREGVVPNVVFPCGNVVHDGTLTVYYGGADAVCGAATVSLEKFLDDLVSENPEYKVEER